MLIQLTHAPSATPGSHKEILVGINQILSVEEGRFGSLVVLPVGKTYDVLQSVDEVADLCDAALTERGRADAGGERKKKREAKAQAEAKKLAEQAKAKADADSAQAKAHADRLAKEAEASRKRAEALQGAAQSGKPLPQQPPEPPANPPRPEGAAQGGVGVEGQPGPPEPEHGRFGSHVVRPEGAAQGKPADAHAGAAHRAPESAPPRGEAPAKKSGK